MSTINHPPHKYKLWLTRFRTKEGDDDWFAKHPDRSYRIRVPFHGEVETCRCHTTLIVVQREPRIRAVEHITHDTVIVIPDNEAFARAWFRLGLGENPDAFVALLEKHTEWRVVR